MQVAGTMNVPEQIYSERKRALTIQLSWNYSHSGFWVLKYFYFKDSTLDPSELQYSCFFLKFIFTALKRRCTNAIKYYLRVTNQSKMQSWRLSDVAKVHNGSLKTLNEQVSPLQHVAVQHVCRAGARCASRAENSPQTLAHIEPLSCCAQKTFRPML